MPTLSAEDLKIKGNECFKEKRYHKAVAYYSESLEQKLDPVVLSNRAQAYLCLQYHEAALTDANESIRLNPDFAKSYYRRSQALVNLGINSKARVDLKRVLTLEPENKAAKELLMKISISYDKPIVPIEVYDKNVYVRSSKPLQQIQIRDNAEIEQSTAMLPDNASPSKMPTRSDTSSGVSTDDEPLPPPAETHTDFAVAHISLKDEPLKFVQYFLSIPLSSFESIFEPGVEPEWIQTIITGLSDGFLINEDILQGFIQLSKAPRFEICVMFLPNQMKNDLFAMLTKFSTSYPSLISKVLEIFQLKNN